MIRSGNNPQFVHLVAKERTLVVDFFFVGKMVEERRLLDDGAFFFVRE